MVLAKFRRGVSRDPVGHVGYTHTQRETLQYSGSFGGTVSSLPSCPAGPVSCSAHQFPCSFLCLELAPIGVEDRDLLWVLIVVFPLPEVDFCTFGSQGQGHASCPHQRQAEEVALKTRLEP